MNLKDRPIRKGFGVFFPSSTLPVMCPDEFGERIQILFLKTLSTDMLNYVEILSSNLTNTKLAARRSDSWPEMRVSISEKSPKKR